MRYKIITILILLIFLTGCVDKDETNEIELDISTISEAFIYIENDDESNYIEISAEDVLDFINFSIDFIGNNDVSSTGKKDSYRMIMHIVFETENDNQHMNLYTNSDSSEYYIGIYLGEGNELLTEEIYSNIPDSIVSEYEKILLELY